MRLIMGADESVNEETCIRKDALGRSRLGLGVAWQVGVSKQAVSDIDRSA